MGGHAQTKGVGEGGKPSFRIDQVNPPPLKPQLDRKIRDIEPKKKKKNFNPFPKREEQKSNGTRKKRSSWQAGIDNISSSLHFFPPSFERISTPTRRGRRVHVTGTLKVNFDWRHRSRWIFLYILKATGEGPQELGSLSFFPLIEFNLVFFFHTIFSLK